MDSPVQIMITEWTIFSELHAVLIVNKETGDVLEQIVFEETELESNISPSIALE